MNKYTVEELITIIEAKAHYYESRFVDFDTGAKYRAVAALIRAGQEMREALRTGRKTLPLNIGQAVTNYDAALGEETP